MAAASIRLHSRSIDLDNHAVLPKTLISEAQTENWTGSRVPSATSLSNSLSTKSLSEYGTLRALQKRGVVPSSTKILALNPC